MAELSEREKEIFGLICEEHSLKEISIKLNISEKTIHSHKAHIQRKLGVKSTVGMIKFAYENGLLAWSFIYRNPEIFKDILIVPLGKTR